MEEDTIIPQLEEVEDEIVEVPKEDEIVVLNPFSIEYNVCTFSRDSVGIRIQTINSGSYAILSQDGTTTSVDVSDTILCKRGDKICLDVNNDGKSDQVETVDFPLFEIDATFHEQYGKDTAYTHISVFTFVSIEWSSTNTSHYQWGNYYIIRNGVRHSLSDFGVTGNWCSGECNPFIKIWAVDGDIIVLDYNNDGIPEHQETIVAPKPHT